MGYNVIRKLFLLPSEQTIIRVLTSLKSAAGLSKVNVDMLKTKIAAEEDHTKICWLMLDEMKLQKGLDFNARQDVIVGFSDDGTERLEKEASSCLVLQVAGLTRGWKHSIGYYLSDSTFEAEKY